MYINIYIHISYRSPLFCFGILFGFTRLFHTSPIFWPKNSIPPVFQRPKLLLLAAFGSGSFGGGAAWMVLEPSPVEETGGQGVCFQHMFVDVCCLGWGMFVVQIYAPSIYICIYIYVCVCVQEHDSLHRVSEEGQGLRYVCTEFRW